MTLAWKSDAEAETVRLNGKVGLDKLGRLPGPISAEFQGAYSQNQDRVEFDKLAVVAGWAKLNASGRVDDLRGSRLADIQGTFDPDYLALTNYLSQNVEPNAQVTGNAGVWRVKGALASLSSGTVPRDLAISAGLVLNEADIYGMKLGPTTFNARWQAGAIAFDPIESTLNGGKLVLRPSIDLDAPGGPVVKLGSDSRLVDAEINDEVSRRVLTFVAPVLDQATHVNGRVSANLVSAEFPIAKSPGKRANVVGSVQFRDVVFAPGPLSSELLAIVGRRPTEGAGLVLNDPVNLTIADGRIEQKGLSVPIGKLAKLEVEGWVDFDRKIGLIATMPINPELFPNAPLLNGVAQATRIRVPIGGTLDQPKIDREAFKENLSKMGRDMLSQTAAQGLIQLFSAMSRPKDPNAPPPPPRPTAQERKAKRMENRAVRLEKKQLD